MRKLLLGLVVGTATIAPSAALAQEDAGPNAGALSFTGGVDFTHAYYFRGYLQENDGFIAQPYFTATAAVTDSISVYAGMWSSLHSEQTGGEDVWYECDWIAGADFTLGPVVLGVNYTLYTSPNDAFDSIHEVQGKITFDDSTLWGKDSGIAFNPYVLVAFELKDGNGTEDAYLEVGAGPAFDVGGLTFTVPMALGMSLDDYYFDDDGDDELLGYATIGLATSIPLPVPSKYGQWSLNASVKYLYLFADGLEAANEGDEHEVIGSVGISFAY